jgi:hypothetical protein
MAVVGITGFTWYERRTNGYHAGTEHPLRLISVVGLCVAIALSTPHSQSGWLYVLLAIPLANAAWHIFDLVKATDAHH